MTVITGTNFPGGNWDAGVNALMPAAAATRLSLEEVGSEIMVFLDGHHNPV